MSNQQNINAFHRLNYSQAALSELTITIEALNVTEKGTLWDSGYKGLTSDVEGDFPVDSFYQIIKLKFTPQNHGNGPETVVTINCFDNSVQEVYRSLFEMLLAAKKEINF